MDKLLNVREVAEALGIGRTRAYELLGRRELRVVRLGRRVLVPASEVDSFIRRKMEEQIGADVRVPR